MPLPHSLLIALVLLALAILLYQNEATLSSLFSSKDVYAEGLALRRVRVRKLFAERVERVRRVCEAERSERVGRVNTKIWSVEPQHGLVICRTAKHGSTTWANYFLQIYTKRSGHKSY